MENRARIKINSYLEVDIHAMRMGVRLGLREICRTLDIDSSNYSKMERGIRSMPENIYTKVLALISEQKEKNRKDMMKNL